MAEVNSHWFELMYDGEFNPLPYKYEELNYRPELRNIYESGELIVFFDRVQNRLRVFRSAE